MLTGCTERALARELAAELGHSEDGPRGVLALLALSPARPRERLLHRVAGQHAERAGDAGVELHARDPARRLGADVLVVVGLAPDHRAEAGHAREAARLGAVLGGQRQLEGAGDRVDLDRRALGLQDPAGTRDQTLGELIVEAGDAERV